MPQINNNSTAWIDIIFLHLLMPKLLTFGRSPAQGERPEHSTRELKLIFSKGKILTGQADVKSDILSGVHKFEAALTGMAHKEWAVHGPNGSVGQ